MHDISADLTKNRLYIILGHISSEDETRIIIHNVMSEVKKLRHDFTCVTDLRNFSLTAGITDHFMQDCQEILWEGGIRKAVRIINGDIHVFDFCFEKFSRIWPGYPTDNARSIEEAENILESL